MAKIKFGTDGWRAVIAQDFTVEHLKRIAEATAIWMQASNLNKVVIGYDTRFGGKMFAETVARVLAAYNIRINMAKSFVTTPMVSLGVLKTKSDLGIMITAGHNAPTFNGYKIRSASGSPVSQTNIAAIEALIPQQSNLALANIKVAYDAMFGAGLKVVKQLLPNAVFLHCEENPAFPGRLPDPTPANLGELAMLVRNTPEIDCGLATNSDGNRLGMYDSDGNFIDSNHLLLLLLSYLKEHKKFTGKVVSSFDTTHKIRKLAKRYGLYYEVTKVGFQHISTVAAIEKILIAGDSSGGITTIHHIPDRDGIWVGLLVLEFMALTGKSLKALLAALYDTTGCFHCNKKDIKVSESRKQTILQHYKAALPSMIGNYPVKKVETIDGYKFIFNEEEWVMLRASETASVLRIYAQAKTREQAKQLLETMTKVISGIGHSVLQA